MKKIIDPVDKELLKAELNQETHLRETNRAGNQLYVVGPEAVNVIREIGRLREIAFRNDGGGTGEALDIDKFDTDPAYEGDTEVVSDGYFHESEFRSAPYFDLQIDGINLLDTAF